MSWLSDRLGIHIGSGPKQIDTSNVPAQVQALGPDAVSSWQQATGNVNNTIGQADRFNTAALGAAGATAGGLGLGALGLGGAGGAAGSAAGAGATGATQTANALGIPGLSWGDLLKAGGNLASGIANYGEQEAARKQQQQEFNQTYGLQAATTAAQLQSALNRAGLADKGQYLAMNMAPPTAFQPRDYTKGLGYLSAQPTGGAAAQLAANQQAANNYQVGMGGVNTAPYKKALQNLGYGT